jgi:hypothetical protein
MKSVLDKLPMSNVTARVIRISQSPMNPLRWLIELGCGHDVWITATKRPTRKTMKCGEKH